MLPVPDYVYAFPVSLFEKAYEFQAGEHDIHEMLCRDMSESIFNGYSMLCSSSTKDFMRDDLPAMKRLGIRINNLEFILRYYSDDPSDSAENKQFLEEILRQCADEMYTGLFSIVPENNESSVSKLLTVFGKDRIVLKIDIDFGHDENFKAASLRRIINMFDRVTWAGAITAEFAVYGIKNAVENYSSVFELLLRKKAFSPIQLGELFGLAVREKNPGLLKMLSPYIKDNNDDRRDDKLA